MSKKAAPAVSAERDSSPSLLDALLCFDIYAVSHAFTRFYKPILDPLGLTYPQYLVLLTLEREDGQGVGTLSKALRLESNTLSPLLRRLEGAGLVARRRSSEDERRVSVHLTAAGRKTAAAAALVPADVIGRLDLSAEELESCGRTLRKLLKVLSEDVDGSGNAPTPEL